MTNTSLYIHIPFCEKKCNYCDFYSLKPENDLMERYIGQAIKELEFYKNHNDIIIDTIYLGGGTPSLLPLFLLEKLTDFIYKNFTVQLKEFSLEVNPCSSENMSFYKDFGVNRLSIGIQSLEDNILSLLGRRHSAKQALEVLERANKHYNNITADLIMGVKEEQRAEKDFLKIKDYVKHISAYILKLEQGTPLFNRYKKDDFRLVDDDNTAEQYTRLYLTLEENGYKRYEISNFSADGFESQHNLKYWQMGDYIGIGTSAHSYFKGKRYFNQRSINDYLNGCHIANGKQIEEQSDKLFETIMLGLRLEKGIDISRINKEFDIDFINEYHKGLGKIKPFIQIQNNFLKIKPEYMLLQNAVAVEFLS